MHKWHYYFRLLVLLASISYIPKMLASGTYVPFSNTPGETKNYATGQAFFNNGQGGLPSCASCHSGVKSLTRSKLMKYRGGSLTRVISNCSIHSVYCSGGRSKISNSTIQAVAQYLQTRYRF